MLQFFFEIIVAVLAVYGGYTALHELGALIGKWIGSPRNSPKEDLTQVGKEDLENERTGRSDHVGRDD